MRMGTVQLVSACSAAVMLSAAAYSPTCSAIGNNYSMIGQTQASGEHREDGKLIAEARSFAAKQASSLQPFFTALYIEGEHNAVLNFDYLGLAAMEAGHYRTAAKAFDAAIERIEAIYANNPSAEKAKSVFAGEKVKDFKGEPYERAMTYFYRGILYARDGDYQNARASFESADLQSTMSEKESYESTFGLMDYLAGWASYCDGDQSQADDLQARAVKLRPQVFGQLSVDVGFVGLIDVGTGPAKIGVGKYHEKLTFKPTEQIPTMGAVTSDNATLSAPVLGADINWQASTRGGRPVDAILHGKAEWKSGTETVSEVAKNVGIGAMFAGLSSGNQDMETAGAISGAIGLISGLIGSAMNPAADTRDWATLPAGIELVTGKMSDEWSVPTLNFSVEAGTSQPTALNSRQGKCAISWGRTVSAIRLGAERVSVPKIAESGEAVPDRQFRAYLEDTFNSEQAAR